MLLKIEKGIPLPSKHGGRAYIKNTLCKMAVGDSIVVKSKYEAMKVRIAAHRLKMQVMQRAEKKAIRVWRTK